MSKDKSKDDNQLMTWLESGLDKGTGVSQHLVNNWLDWIKAGPAQDMGRQLIGQVKEKYPDTIEAWIRLVDAGVGHVSNQNSPRDAKDDLNQDEVSESEPTDPSQSS